MLDRTGERFGRLIILGFAKKVKKNIFWRCRCDCGVERVVQWANLASGRTRACGCLHRERASEANITHGFTCNGVVPPQYHVWQLMKNRCYNINADDYKYYGARGIKVCAQWKDSFATFWADMGLTYRPGLTIDRIDNDGDYTPENCRWITQQEQLRNYRRNVYVLLDSGEQLLLTDAAKVLGINRNSVEMRARRL